MAKEIAEEYTSSLADLTLNSKPLINMLTMLADDNIEHAEAIVQAVEKHLEKVRSEYKLPVLYLIDSIVKNVGRAYTQLFTQNIVNTFCSVFEKVDEKVRAQMFKLRQTWNEVFAGKKLYTLDIRVQCIDPAWPITAPSPTPSIHVNPKFFNKPTTPPVTVTTAAPVTTTAAAAINLDPATLDMHTQLINKQKELLELKQKKLELELLQAKAKLEEQQKQLQIHTQQVKPQTTTSNQNLLLKPEVSKQLNQSGGLLGVKPTEKSSSKYNTTQNTQVQLSRSQQQQQIITSAVNVINNSNITSGGTRIAPVNSAMIAAAAAAVAAASARPTVRDPRLLRQQPGIGGGSGTRPHPHPVSTVPQLSTQITSNTNNFENVNIDDKKVKSKSNNTINIDCGSDKASSLNKSDNTLNRKDPRLLTNKAPGSSSLNKSRSSNGRPVSSERSPTKQKTSPNQSRKSSSTKSTSSRSFKSSGTTPVHKLQLDVVATSGENNHSSVSIIKSVKDSTSNTNININTIKGSSETNKSSPSSSPNKYSNNSNNSNSNNRKDKKSEHSDKSVEQQKQQRTTKIHKTSDNINSPNININTSTSTSNKSRSRDRSDKYDDESCSPINTTVTTNQQSSDQQRTFKGLKGTTKNRNYMRRNRAVSNSPELSQDVDLRVCAPPEKQPRLQQTTDPVPEEITKSTTLDDNSSVNKDVDLRTLVPLAINKKRSSTEKLEASNAKKSKSQMFDVLFGNEDVDLRQLPSSISNQSTTPTSTPSVVKRPPTPPPPIISTISAKPDTKQKGNKADKTEWNAIRAKLAKATKKSSLEDIRRQLSEDTDMRKKPVIFGSNTSEKIIISKDDEQKIKQGNLSQALVEKVLTLFETQKLQEAQRRESEEFKTSDQTTVILQPISDDELSVDFSHSDSDDDPKIVRKSDVFGDQDERVAPPAPVISSSKDQNQPEQQNHNDPRVGNPRVAQNIEHNWHHRRRKMIKSHWDSPPQHHTTPEPWIRPPAAVLNQALYGSTPRRPFQSFMRQPSDNFPTRMETVTVPSHVLEINRTASPPTIGSQNTRELPAADPLVLEYIDKDTMRAINIDGRLREIRYYDETAIAIMSWDDPREITFQSGTRHVTFDDKESYMLSFNDIYKDVTVGGKAHRIRLGAPTRELYIDGKWYECFFGGPGIGIEIDGKICVVKLDGPPPHVKIGNVKRNDFVAGKISLIINARTMIPIFLDAKPQKFDIEGKLHTLRFVDALRTVLINEVPFKVEFGGLPKPITVHDKKHFIRFSILPKGIKPGYVKIANMEGQRFPTPPRNDENSNDALTLENIAANVSVNEPALPMLGKRKMRTNQGENSPDRYSPIMQNSSLQSLGSLDVLSSIMTSPSIITSSINVSGYQVEESPDSLDGFPVFNKQNKETPSLTTTEEQPPVAAPPSLPFNINELFELLVTTGVITTETTQKVPPSKDEDSYIKPVLFSHPETLKVRQHNIMTTLYSGMQCSSCGVRFPPEHSMQYSQHLDWHFRQNRRGRNSARKALCRKWYYEVSDWKNYEEIEDIEEREKNWFESQQQQQQAEGLGEDGEEEIEIPSVPADSNSQETCCEVCHDKFEQFYNEEKEEWHLRMAIRVDDKTYHPLCYDDHKASLLTEALQQHHSVSESEEIKENETETEPTKTEEEAAGEEAPEKMEIDDEEKAIENEEETIEKEEKLVPDEEEIKIENDVKIDDDEVIIQEPKIEQIIIDDNLDDDDKSNDIKTELYPVIKIKEEPMDDTDICITNIKTEPLDSELEEMNSVIPADTTSAEILTSIDGNVQLNTDMPSSGANTIPGKIKINITKPILAPKETSSTAAATDSEKSADSAKDSNEPLPPGEELVQLNLKPELQGLTLTKQPVVYKGTELTGLCSIM